MGSPRNYPANRSKPVSADDFWTRVLSVSHRQIDYNAKFSITIDLANELEANEEQQPFEDNLSWPIFLPDAWAKVRLLSIAP